MARKSEMNSKPRSATQEIQGRIELLKKQAASSREEADRCQKVAQIEMDSAAACEVLAAEYADLISHREL